MSTRALTITKAGAIEDDDPVLLQQELRNAAGVPIVAGHGIPVDQHDGTTLAAVAVMQPDAIHSDEQPLGRMPAFRVARHEVVGGGERGQGSYAGERGGTGGM